MESQGHPFFFFRGSPALTLGCCQPEPSHVARCNKAAQPAKADGPTPTAPKGVMRSAPKTAPKACFETKGGE